MALRTSKPAFNLREKVSELDRPVGSHGSQVMKSDNVGETFDLIQAGRRNTIINGCMRFNQRGKSAYAGTECTLDRWKFHRSTDGEFDIKQSTEAPSGFSHSLHVDCRIASATVTSNSYARMRYFIEGHDCRKFGKGTQTPKNFCLSFYVKTNITGTYAVNLQDHNSKIITRTYTVTDDKWNRYTIVFPNSTANPITTTNASGMEIQFILIAGLNQTGGDARNWGAWAANKQGDGHTVNLYSSTSNNLYLTGVQLEPGNQATSFENRSYGEELKLCERYYEVHWQNTNPSNPAGSHGDGFNAIASGGISGSRAYFPIRWRTQKRAQPALSYGGKFRVSGGGSTSNVEPDEFYSPSIDGGRIRTPHSGSGSTGQACWLEFDQTNGANIGYFRIDAEM